MKNILKIILGFICYKIEFRKPDTKEFGWKKLPEGCERYRFVAKPRKLNIIIFAIIMIVPTVILFGIFGWLSETQKMISKTRSWSSYEVFAKKGKKPSVIDAYKLI